MAAWVRCQQFGSGHEIWINFDHALTMQRDNEDTRTFVRFGEGAPSMAVNDKPDDIASRVKQPN
jgi:hypothetical protein